MGKKGDFWKDPLFLGGVVLLAFVFLNSGVSPYFSFLNYASGSAMLAVTGGDPSQPIDHPIFNPGNVTFSETNVTFPNYIHYEVYSYTSCSGTSDDMAAYRNAFQKDGSYYIIARVLTKPDGSKELIDGQVYSYFDHPDTSYNEGNYNNGCYRYETSSSSVSGVYYICKSAPFIFDSKSVSLNDSGMYTISTVTLQIPEKSVEELNQSLLNSFEKIYLKSFEDYSAHQGSDYPYSYTTDQCFDSVGNISYTYNNLTSVFKECGGSNSECYKINTCAEVGLQQLKTEGVVSYTWERYEDCKDYIVMYGVYIRDNETVMNLLDNGSYDVNYTFEIKPSAEILEEQLAELRADYDVQINELLTKLDNENLTADEFKALMDEYKTLLENKTDARLVEKLVLLRYDFEYKLKQYKEEDMEQYNELLESWGETIPLLQVDVQALQEKVALLQRTQEDLEQQIALLNNSGDIEGAAEKQQELSLLQRELTDLENELDRIGWYKVNPIIRVSTLGSLGLFAFSFVRRKF